MCSTVCSFLLLSAGPSCDDALIIYSPVDSPLCAYHFFVFLNKAATNISEQGFVAIAINFSLV